MEVLTNLLKLKALEGMRTYIGIAGLWFASAAEWNGFDVPGFVAMDPLNTLMATMVALGIYERVRS